MNTPADRTAKRLSRDEWYARYDATELLKAARHGVRVSSSTPAPADRIAVRA